MNNNNEIAPQKPWLDPGDPVRRELLGDFEVRLRKSKRRDEKLGAFAIPSIKNWAHPMYDSELSRAIEQDNREQFFMRHQGELLDTEPIVDEDGKVVGEKRTYKMPIDVSATAVVNVRDEMKH